MGYLQRAVGNQITARLLRAHAIQPKLTVNRPDDEYEREADRVADEVMRMPEPSPVSPSSGTVAVQRKCSECEEEEVHRKPAIRQRRAPAVASRMCHTCALEHHDHAEAGGGIKRRPELGNDEEEEAERKVQAKHSTSDPPEVSADVDAYLAHAPAGRPMMASTRAYFEPRFAQDFSGVRVHTDQPAAASAAALQARAYTVGSNVFFGASQYAPETAEGRKLLAHELTHVLQQGRASGTSSTDASGPARIGRQISIRSGPDDKPKGGPKAPADKAPDLELELPGGRKEKIDLTKVKGKLWWFNGARPVLSDVGAYLTQFAMKTGLSAGKFNWTVSKGADKVKLLDGTAMKTSVTYTADTAVVRSVGPSASANDVTLTLTHTPKGAKTADSYNTSMDVRAPRLLIPKRTVDSAKEGGFSTLFEYTLKDNLGDDVPYLDYNEDFGPEVWDSATAQKMSRFPPRNKGSSLTDGAAVLRDHFEIFAAATKTAKMVPPITNPQKPLSTTKILHFWQKWYVGSRTTGRGVLVQDNKGQMYTDHGRHEDIVSPPAAPAPAKKTPAPATKK